MKNVLIVGMGAIGSAILYHLNKTNKSNIYVLAKGKYKEKLENGILIKGKNYKVNFQKEDITYDLIIVSVKFNDLEKAILDLKPYVSKNTIILPLLNGVKGEEVLLNTFNKENVIGGVIHLSSFYVDNYGYDFNPGTIFLGLLDNSLNIDLSFIKDILENDTLKVIIHKDIMRRKWYKFLINLSENIPLAIVNLPYKSFKENKYVDTIRINLLEEGYSVIKAKGINISDKDIKEINDQVYTLPEEGIPSTLQDIRAKRKTEVDLFTLQLIEEGKKVGIDTPYANLCHLIIKALEFEF